MGRPSAVVAAGGIRLGYAAWIGAASCCVVLAVTGTMIPRRMLAFETVTVPALVVAHHWLLGRTQTFTRITVVAFLFLVPVGLHADLHRRAWVDPWL